MWNPTLKVIVWMLFACAASAQTGTAGPAGKAAMQAVDPALCDALANMPNSPMTVAACRSMMQLAKDDPSAHRKGDGAMTCADIFAEPPRPAWGFQTPKRRGGKNPSATHKP
jgi:hypothetical protein